MNSWNSTLLSKIRITRSRKLNPNTNKQELKILRLTRLLSKRERKIPSLMLRQARLLMLTKSLKIPRRNMKKR